MCFMENAGNFYQVFDKNKLKAGLINQSNLINMSFV